MMYGVYDTKNNDVCLGIMTSKEITEQFGITMGSFYCFVTRKQLLRKRYEIIGFKDFDLEGEEVGKEKTDISV